MKSRTIQDGKQEGIRTGKLNYKYSQYGLSQDQRESLEDELSPNIYPFKCPKSGPNHISDISSTFTKKNAQYEALFAPYANDIKEVRSLVNLWREEFERRIESNLDLMDKVKKSDPNRDCGYSESLMVSASKNARVMKQLKHHLKIVLEENQEDPSVYEPLPSFDFEIMRKLIN